MRLFVDDRQHLSRPRSDGGGGFLAQGPLRLPSRSVDKGKAEKVAAAGFDAYVRGQCASAGTTFRDAMVSFDVKNKVPRKQAASDAESQVTDYYVETGERYKFQTETAGAKPQ